MRLLTMVLASIAVIFLGGIAVAQDPAGTWTGTVDQPGWGSYDVVMVLDSASGGTSDYPGIPCSGSLSGGGSGGVYTFTETITAYRENCVDNGRIRFVVQGDNAFWEWSGSQDGVSYYASGTLHRAASNTTSNTGHATCNECGVALLNDLSAGLGRSAGLRDYVNEAISKYDNCTQDLPNACANQCGYQARDNLPTCGSWDEEQSYRVCVDRIHSGAVLECQR